MIYADSAAFTAAATWPAMRSRSLRPSDEMMRPLHGNELGPNGVRRH
jgi:hypothetical protein